METSHWAATCNKALWDRVWSESAGWGTADPPRVPPAGFFECAWNKLRKMKAKKVFVEKKRSRRNSFQKIHLKECELFALRIHKRPTTHIWSSVRNKSVADVYDDDLFRVDNVWGKGFTHDKEELVQQLHASVSQRHFMLTSNYFLSLIMSERKSFMATASFVDPQRSGLEQPSGQDKWVKTLLSGKHGHRTSLKSNPQC